MTLTWYDILILLGVPSIVFFIFQVVYNGLSTKMKKEKTETTMIKKALQALLRDRLREHYIEYTEKGTIDIADKENFDNMYQIYHALGKNGVMDTMYDKVMNLPITPKQRHVKRQVDDSEELIY